MNEANIKDLFDKNFPFYKDQEKEIIKDLVTHNQSDGNRYQNAKKKFLKIIYNDLVDFYRWDATPNRRREVRKRLLNIVGIFFILPLDDIRGLANKARLTQKKVVYESAPNPVIDQITEMHSYDLKYIKDFAQFFSQIELDEDITALDYLAGSREKRHYPRTQTTVFGKSILDEVIAKDFITASAEPLTQTQFIALSNPDGTPRDLITIGFDMIYESAFIDFFHNAPKVCSITLPRNGHLVGKHFLLSALETTLKKRRTGSKDWLKNFPVFRDKKEDTSDNERADRLIEIIKEELVPEITQKVKDWNEKLGLAEDNEEVYWG